MSRDNEEEERQAEGGWERTIRAAAGRARKVKGGDVGGNVSVSRTRELPWEDYSREGRRLPKHAHLFASESVNCMQAGTMSDSHGRDHRPWVGQPPAGASHLGQALGFWAVLTKGSPEKTQ